MDWKGAGSVKSIIELYIEDLRTGSDGRKAASDARYRRLQLPELNEKRSTTSQTDSIIAVTKVKILPSYPAKACWL